MGVIAWIIIGLLAGWLATQILGGRGGLLYNLAVGLVGAIVGGFLFEKLRLQVVPDFWGNLITAPRKTRCRAGASATGASH